MEEDSTLSVSKRSLLGFASIADWFGDGEEIDYAKVLLPPVDEEEYPFLSLPHFPPDLFASVSHFLSPQDLFVLWCTGSRHLRALMSVYGGVQDLDMEFKFDRQVGLPAFPAYLKRLRRVSIMHNGGINSLLLRPFLDSQLNKWPSTLEEICIKSDMPLLHFYQANSLIIEYENDKIPAKAEDRILTRLRATSAKLCMPDPSAFFYNLTELFPRLTVLKLWTEGDQLPLLAKNVKEGSVFLEMEQEILERLINDDPTMNAGTGPGTDFNRPDYEDIVKERAFMKSLPPTLTSCQLGFPHTWFYESFTHLPASVTELTIDSLANFQYMDDTDFIGEQNIAEIFEHENEDSTGLSPLIEALQIQSMNENAQRILDYLDKTPQLPSSIKSLRLLCYGQDCIETLILKLPPALTSLFLASAGSPMYSWMAKRLPRTLETLECVSNEDFVSLRMLPRSLTHLSFIENSIVSTKHAMPSSAKECFPPALTKLSGSFRGSGLSDLLDCIQMLPIKELVLESYYVDVTESLAARFPKTLEHCHIAGLQISLVSNAEQHLPVGLKSLILESQVHHAILGSSVPKMIPSNLTSINLSFSLARKEQHITWPSALVRLTLHVRPYGNDNRSKTTPKIKALFFCAPSLPPQRKQGPTKKQKNNRRKNKFDPELWDTEPSSSGSNSSRVTRSDSTSPTAVLAGSTLPPSLTKFAFHATFPEDIVKLLPRGLKCLSLENQYHSHEVVIPARHLPSKLTSLQLRHCHMFADEWKELPRGLRTLSMPARMEVSITGAISLDAQNAFARQLPRQLNSLTLDMPVDWSQEMIRHLPKTLHRLDFPSSKGWKIPTLSPPIHLLFDKGPS
jgi:hypothetical protein